MYIVAFRQATSSIPELTKFPWDYSVTQEDTMGERNNEDER